MRNILHKLLTYTRQNVLRKRHYKMLRVVLILVQLWNDSFFAIKPYNHFRNYHKWISKILSSQQVNIPPSVGIHREN